MVEHSSQFLSFELNQKLSVDEEASYEKIFSFIKKVLDKYAAGSVRAEVVKSVLFDYKGEALRTQNEIIFKGYYLGKDQMLIDMQKQIQDHFSLASVHFAISSKLGLNDQFKVIRGIYNIHHPTEPINYNPPEQLSAIVINPSEQDLVQLLKTYSTINPESMKIVLIYSEELLPNEHLPEIKAQQHISCFIAKEQHTMEQLSTLYNIQIQTTSLQNNTIIIYQKKILQYIHLHNLLQEGVLQKCIQNTHLIHQQIQSEAQNPQLKDFDFVEDQYLKIHKKYEKFITDSSQVYDYRYLLGLSRTLSKTVSKTGMFEWTISNSLKSVLSFTGLSIHRENIIQELMEDFYSQIDSEVNINAQYKINIISTTSMKKGKVCSKCGKNIESISQYVSMESKEVFCQDCESLISAEQEVKIKEGTFQNDHIHIFYFVPVSIKDDLLERIIVFGLKLNPEAIKLLKKEHDMIWCSYCKENINGIRWKCANCRDVNICNNCFQNLFSMKEYPQKGQIIEHPFLEHIYVKIPFNQIFL